MKLNSSSKTVLAVLLLLVLAGLFWMMLLAPKREKTDELGQQANQLKSEVAVERQRVETSLAAKRRFPEYYRQLVLLGKAVPPEAATASLLVQLNTLSSDADAKFMSISLGGSGGEESAEATEADLPIGAGGGPSGLLSMRYGLRFDGGFFELADFVHGMDSLVTTKGGEVDPNGRLITIDGFSFAPPDKEGSENSSELTGSFQVSTYVTPPGQGLTAGATAAGPASEIGVEG
jgi:Tfp pilus assembly protein PilO